MKLTCWRMQYEMNMFWVRQESNMLTNMTWNEHAKEYCMKLTCFLIRYEMNMFWIQHEINKLTNMAWNGNADERGIKWAHHIFSNAVLLENGIMKYLFCEIIIVQYLLVIFCFVLLLDQSNNHNQCLWGQRRKSLLAEHQDNSEIAENSEQQKRGCVKSSVGLPVRQASFKKLRWQFWCYRLYHRHSVNRPVPALEL